MKEKLAVYAGTFDPLTNGHLWVIEQGLKLFDRLVVALGINPEKQCMFSVENRLEMIREATQQLPNLKITTTDQFLVNYTESIGAQFFLRGIRSGDDYEYEKAMRNVNSKLKPNVITVFLMPPPDLFEVSSSMIRGLIGPEGWESIVQRYVPESVFEKIKEKYHGK